MTGENERTRSKTCHSNLSMTSPAWTDPGANLGLSSEKSATNRLSHCTAPHLTLKLTVRSPAENLWLESGVVADVMPCDRDGHIHSNVTFDATIHSEKNDSHHNSFIRQVVVPVLTCL
jgi:hypothetical protein